MDMGEFLNNYVKDALNFWLLTGSMAGILALFSVIYNHWMDTLGEKKQGYTALLVALGNGITLLAVATISWKAAALVAVAFIVSGAAMITGDIRRGSRQRDEQAVKQQRPRRKALPYAAAGLIDDAIMTLAQVERGLVAVLEGKSDDRKIGLMALAIKDASAKLSEARKVEGE